MATDRITSIEVFARAWERGSFSAAARELGFSPASVGNHVRALEEWLGVRLLQRTTRRLALTEAGEQFLQSARSILHVAAEAKAAAAALRATPRGMLRLSAPASYGTRVLAAIVADYLLDHPDMKIEVALSERRVDLLEEGFDLAIRVGELSDSDLVARRLASAPFVLCAAPCYLERRGQPRHPADLASHECLEYSLRFPRGRWRFTAPDGKPFAQAVTARLKATNGEFLRIAALKGLGLTLAPLFIVSDDLDAGRLVPVMTDFPPFDTSIHAIYPADRRLPLKVRSFVDFVADALRDDRPRKSSSPQMTGIQTHASRHCSGRTLA